MKVMKGKDMQFEGYWSEEDKELWKQTNWSARDYEDLEVPIEGFLRLPATFYGEVPGGEVRELTFVKVLRANPIYPPYYRPYSKTKDELKDFEGRFMSSCYDGHTINGYPIHDRFETKELYEELSR